MIFRSLAAVLLVLAIVTICDVFGPTAGQVESAIRDWLHVKSMPDFRVLESDSSFAPTGDDLYTADLQFTPEGYSTFVYALPREHQVTINRGEQIQLTRTVGAGYYFFYLSPDATANRVRIQYGRE